MNNSTDDDENHKIQYPIKCVEIMYNRYDALTTFHLIMLCYIYTTFESGGPTLIFTDKNFQVYNVFIVNSEVIPLLLKSTVLASQPVEVIKSLTTQKIGAYK